MEYTLRQAKHTNPDTEIILIGDEANNRFNFVTHINIKDYFTKAAEIAKIYKHYSTNPYAYELFCFQRWIILNETIIKNNIKKVFVCDSDMLLYANIDKLIPTHYNKIDAGFLYNEKNKAFNAAISYWTAEALDDLCSVIFNTYQDDDRLNILKKKYEIIIEQNDVGGFSDMIAVETYYLKNKTTANIANFAEECRLAVFDTNISYPGTDKEYNYKKGIKNLTIINKVPYCLNILNRRNIKFNSLHFQGPAKYSIPYYFTADYFKGKYKLDIIFKFLNIIATIYKRLKIRNKFAFVFNYLNREKK